MASKSRAITNAFQTKAILKSLHENTTGLAIAMVEAADEVEGVEVEVDVAVDVEVDVEVEMAAIAVSRRRASDSSCRFKGSSVALLRSTSQPTPSVTLL